MSRSRALLSPAIIALGFVLLAGVYPLLRLLLVPLFPGLAPPQMTIASDQSLSFAAITYTSRIGIEAGIAAMLPGFALAYVLERFDWAGNRVLAGSLWLLLLTPSYLLSTGWQLFLSMPALAGGALDRLFFSEGGIVFLLVLKSLPFACLAARACWAMIGGEIGAALRIHVRSPWRRALVLAHLAAPSAGAIFAVVFIEAIADFGIAATLGAHLRMPLVIYGIYTALARTPIDFRHAATLSLVLVALAAGAVMLHQYLAARGARSSSRTQRAPRQRPTTAQARSAAAATAILILLVFVIPGAALAVRAFGAAEPVKVDLEDWLSIAYSVCYAFVGATLSTMLAIVLLGFGSTGSPRLGRLIDTATLGSMAVPGIVLGAAYIIAFNGWLPIYGTPMLLLLGFVATHLPMLMRFLQAPLQNAHASLADAAALHGLGRMTRIEQIHAPLLLRPVLWGWALAFGAIFFELPLASLLYPIGRAPLGIQLLLLDESLHFAAEARLAIIGVLACLAVVGLVVWVLPWWLSRPSDGARLPAPARSPA